MEVSLYLHIPFCEAKCAYCDFYSIPLNSPGGAERDLLMNRYTGALLEETARRFDELRREKGGPVTVPSIYIGGGTPSLLGASGIARILDGVSRITGSSAAESNDSGYTANVPEVTVEANPESADAAFLAACANHGVTRLSLGVQSFDETARRAAGRQGRAELLPERLAAASEIFGRGLSLDLITGLPGQTLDTVYTDIDRALSYCPGHISLYALTLEEGVPLARSAAGSLPSRDDADRLWLAGRDALIQAGYEQYEVSNFALQETNGSPPAFRCAHNIRYWRMENWIGAGPAASGTIIDEISDEISGEAPGKISGAVRGRRISYRSGVETFITHPAACIVVEELDRITLIKESLLMGFRYIEGPGAELFKRRFGLTLEEAIPRTLQKWRNTAADGSGNSGMRRGKTALTSEGLLFLNRFVRDAFAELDYLPSMSDSRRYV